MRLEDKQLIDRLVILRENYEKELQRQLDEHMDTYYKNRIGLWKVAKRSSLEVAHWPKRKRKGAYAQKS